MARFPIESDDTLHVTLMNIAAAVDVNGDHKWKEEDVLYLGRRVCHLRANALGRFLALQFQGTSQVA